MLMLSDLIRTLQAHMAVCGDLVVAVQSPVSRERIAKAAARHGGAIAVPGVEITAFIDPSSDGVLVLAATRELRWAEERS